MISEEQRRQDRLVIQQVNKTFIRCVAVDLPRPRRTEHLALPQTIQLKQELTSLFLEQVTR